MSEKRVRLIVGLGNIGNDYAETRHNLGFLCIDRLATNLRVNWQVKAKFKAAIAEVNVKGQRLILAKPTTFYNLSGEAVSLLASFYKIPSKDILVIHDELDLPFGKIRTRIGGSDAGNNGVKNITSHIGEGYARIRVGIANEQLPAKDAADFVLDYFLPVEQQVLPKIADHTIHFAQEFIDDTNEFLHTSVEVL